MDRTDSVEMKELKKENRKPGRSCVICVGSTGAGKSSTVSKVTGQDAPSGDGVDRVTSQCQVFIVSDRETDPLWIDTVGWEDRFQDDEASFQEVLSFLKDQGTIDSIAGVIWNVIPNVRRDAVLSRQAKLIDLLGGSSGAIWKNVIVVCKQSMKPERDGTGAVKAAMEYGMRPQIVGYRFYSDLDEEQKAKLENNPEMRGAFNVKTDDEVQDVILQALSQCGDPVPIEFRECKCMDCGQIGDPRLMSFFCHMESHHVHTGKVSVVHPEAIENYHESDVQIAEHNGRLHKPWFVQLGLAKGKRFTCCGKKAGKSGCTVKWACCKEVVQDYSYDDESTSGCQRRYACCKVAPEAAGDGCELRHECCGRRTTDLGCVELCRKCDKPWGTPTENCFRKEHNVTDNLGISLLSPDGNGGLIMLPNQDGLVNNNNKEFKYVFGLPPIVSAKPY